MKAIVDKNGCLWHEQGRRKWPVECPYNESESVEQVLAVNDEKRTMHYHRQCSDWCSLWHEISTITARTGNTDTSGVRIVPLSNDEETTVLATRFERYDCRGNMHIYDAYEDQREGGKE